MKIMNKIKAILKGFITPDHLLKRFILVLFGCTMMAFCLSWLNLTNLGTDPYTNMNLAFAERLHMSFGNWQALFNTSLFVIVLIFGSDNNFGFGTLVNMLLIGYEVDFFSSIWAKVLPAGLFDSLMVRWGVMLVGVVVFVFAVAVYMNAGLGTSPYDALPYIINEKLFPKLSFKVIRMAYDFAAILIGVLLNGKLFAITIIMALLLGTVIQYVAKKIEKLF